MTNYILVTDGSIEDPHKSSTGGYGFRFSKIDEKGNKEFLFSGGGSEVNTTNNRMEITAIKEGLYAVSKYFDENGFKKDDNLIVISDSDLCVRTLTQYIFKWIKGMVDGIIYGSTKKPVINQDVILEAFKIICGLRELMRVHVFHIKSHLSIKNRQIDMDYFIKRNNCSITPELFNSIVAENELVDDLAYGYMKGTYKEL